MTQLPDWARQARAKWQYTGKTRPSFAVAPQPGQESVWDYPRPPRVETDVRDVVVMSGNVTLARTVRALRVLETAGPPVFYIPITDIDGSLIEAAQGSSLCEWKGEAHYWSVVGRAGQPRLEKIAWGYPAPFPGYEAIRDHLSFYPARLTCTVGGVPVRPQPGGFYGGWVTPEIVGPFKGEPGTESW